MADLQFLSSTYLRLDEVDDEHTVKSLDFPVLTLRKYTHAHCNDKTPCTNNDIEHNYN